MISSRVEACDANKGLTLELEAGITLTANVASRLHKRDKKREWQRDNRNCSQLVNYMMIVRLSLTSSSTSTMAYPSWRDMVQAIQGKRAKSRRGDKSNLLGVCRAMIKRRRSSRLQAGRRNSGQGLNGCENVNAGGNISLNIRSLLLLN